MNLKTLGWRDTLEKEFLPFREQGLLPARVVRQDRNRYLVHTESKLLPATVLGRLLYEAEEDYSVLPVVGDWVAVQLFDYEAIIHAVLPRRSSFVRKEAGHVTRRQVIASNIDIVFLVSGLDNDFNVRRIERYIVQAASSKARCVIILNKADLHDNIDDYVEKVKVVSPETDVIVASALDGSNIEKIKAYLEEGTTVAFLGSSGVGKSTLVNRLTGSDVLATGEVREDDSRGRHTTTHRELIQLTSGACVIDTPGLRELQLWSTEEDLGAIFDDIEVLARSCKFSDCKHESEPDCAIREALQSGELAEERYNSYLKLKREIDRLHMRQSSAALMKEKKRQKNFGKMLKEIQRNNPKTP